MHLAEVLAIAMRREPAEPPGAYPETDRPDIDLASARTGPRAARLAVGTGLVPAGLAARQARGQLRGR